ncbi:YhcN/YlaJ family sporulation lipoprotein [Solibacillus sp. FSL R5-0691]|uniref:YhcN/YlaJ family sporulation lipoprotein n=1 Tax=unclassified Solibacillus TaxID=2637870 RepID=UPI0030CCDBE8
MWKAILTLSLLLILAGCNDREKVVTYALTDNEQNQQEIEKLLKEDDAIEQANLLVIEDELFVAMQLKPFEKWNRKKIEEDWKKKLEDKFSDSKVNVSADFKMFWESTKLMEEKDQKKMLKELHALKKLAKEET